VKICTKNIQTGADYSVTRPQTQHLIHGFKANYPSKTLGYR